MTRQTCCCTGGGGADTAAADARHLSAAYMTSVSARGTAAATCIWYMFPERASHIRSCLTVACLHLLHFACMLVGRALSVVQQQWAVEAPRAPGCARVSITGPF